MRRLIVWVFHALVITVPFAFTAINDELFEFNKMMLIYVYTALIAGAWIIRMLREKRLIFQKTPLFFPLIFFLLSQVLSTLTSIHPATSIFGYYSRFHGGLLSSLSYLLLYFAAASNLRRPDLRPLIRSLVWSGLGAALYALPEHFGISPSCVLITGEFSVSCWVQDVQTRVFGTFGQPNWLAAYLLLMLPLAIWLRQTSLSKWERWLSAAMVPIFYAVLLFTGSRSGFLGLLVGIGFFGLHRLSASGLLHSIWRAIRFGDQTTWEKIRLPVMVGTKIATLSLGSMLILTLVFGTPFTPSVTKYLTSKSSISTPVPVATAEVAPPSGTVLDSGGTNSGEIRRIVWQGALAVWRRYPIFGSGVETFAYSYYQDRPMEHNLVSEWDFLYNKAHNEFLNALATTGAVGLAALFWLMGSVMFRLFRRSSLLATAVLSGYTALAVSNFFGFSTVMVGVLFFLLPALVFIEERAGDPELKPAAKHPRPHAGQSTELEFELDTAVLGQALVCFFTLAAIWLVWRSWDNDRLLASAKRQVALGQSLAAYQEFSALTTRAPNEALFWDESSVFLAGLAAAAGPTDATLAAQLANEAAAASDQAVSLNPVHLSLWKSRAKVYLYLATLNPSFYNLALEALDQAARLAPTDPKIQFNRAVLLSNLERFEEARAAFESAITMKPNYEQAKQEYEQFQQKIATQSAKQP